MQNYTLFDFILLAVALFLIPARSFLFRQNLAKAELSQKMLLRRYVSILIRNVAISLYIVVFWQLSGRAFGLLGLGAPTDFHSRIGFFLDIALLAILAAQYLRVGNISPQRLAKLQEGMKSNKIAPRNLVEFSVFFAVAIVGSVSEELLYRGFIISLFSPLVGLVGAIGSSAIVFGLGHAYQGWRNVVRTSLIGLVFAIAYVATGSLWWLVVAHVIMNIFGGVFGLRIATLSARTSSATV